VRPASCGTTHTQAKAVKVTGDTIPLYDYAPIPNAYVELPASTQIANEGALTRAAATAIFYQLKITRTVC